MRYEIFIKMLHDKGVVESIQVATNMTPGTPAEFPDSLKEAIKKKCISSSISMAMDRNPELKKAFDLAACEIMFTKIVKDLDLKKDENYKPTEADLLAKSMAEKLAELNLK